MHTFSGAPAKVPKKFLGGDWILGRFLGGRNRVSNAPGRLGPPKHSRESTNGVFFAHFLATWGVNPATWAPWETSKPRLGASNTLRTVYVFFAFFARLARDLHAGGGFNAENAEAAEDGWTLGNGGRQVSADDADGRR